MVKESISACTSLNGCHRPGLRRRIDSEATMAVKVVMVPVCDVPMHYSVYHHLIHSEMHSEIQEKTASCRILFACSFVPVSGGASLVSLGIVDAARVVSCLGVYQT